MNQEGDEISDTKELRSRIDESCRTLTAAKSFKTNLPDDWDSCF